MAQLIGIIWNNFLINPMINSTVVLYRVLFNNYGLAIIVFTLMMRLLTLPLTLQQLRSSRMMTQLQPRINEIQKKHKDPKRRSEETMKLYKEEGANPAGCLLPMLIQFPIWIALYSVIRETLGTTPESLIGLSGKLYPWNFVQHAVPLQNHFLIWDMGKPDQSFILPVLVGGSMWLQQKLTMTQGNLTPANQTQQQTNQMMLWMMPLMFGWFTLTVPAGLAIYWMVSNVVGIVMNYYVFGWKGTDWKKILLTPSAATAKRSGPAGRGRLSGSDGSVAALLPGSNGKCANRDDEEIVEAGSVDVVDPPTADRSRMEKRGVNDRNGRGGNKRKDDRGGNRQSTPTTRSRSGPGRDRGS
ncbi:MAG: YidC/Oxa1 family membrane protein insertase [Dehalococcoidia bacterium]